MSEYFFGVGHRPISQELGEQLDAIAHKHDATFTWVQLPEGPRSWFACRNLGHPYDAMLAAAVEQDVVAAGLDYFRR